MRTIVGGVLGKIPRPTPAMAVALLALLIAASGAAVAAGSFTADDGTITACRDNKSGVLRVINAQGGQACGAKETTITWKDGITGTVADSELLDGKSADDLSRVAVMNTDATTLIPSDGTRAAYGTPLSITAPAAGFVRVNGNVSVVNADCVSGCTFDAWVRHVNTDTYSTVSIESLETNEGGTPGFHEANAGLDAVFPVSAGVNTFEIRFRQEGSGGRLFGDFGVLTAEYTPYGSTGAGPQSGSAEQ
jgi:hypothetical protein